MASCHLLDVTVGVVAQLFDDLMNALGCFRRDDAGAIEHIGGGAD